MVKILSFQHENFGAWCCGEGVPKATCCYSERSINSGCYYRIKLIITITSEVRYLFVTAASISTVMSCNTVYSKAVSGEFGDSFTALVYAAVIEFDLDGIYPLTATKWLVQIKSKYLSNYNISFTNNFLKRSDFGFTWFWSDTRGRKVWPADPQRKVSLGLAFCCLKNQVQRSLIILGF